MWHWTRLITIKWKEKLHYKDNLKQERNGGRHCQNKCTNTSVSNAVRLHGKSSTPLPTKSGFGLWSLINNCCPLKHTGLMPQSLEVWCRWLPGWLNLHKWLSAIIRSFVLYYKRTWIAHDTEGVSVNCGTLTELSQSHRKCWWNTVREL